MTPPVRHRVRLSACRAHEADAARVTLKARRQTVREFLRARFGIVTGAREYWHRENWMPDRADLRDLLAAIRSAKGFQLREKMG